MAWSRSFFCKTICKERNGNLYRSSVLPEKAQGSASKIYKRRLTHTSEKCSPWLNFPYFFYGLKESENKHSSESPDNIILLQEKANKIYPWKSKVCRRRPIRPQSILEIFSYHKLKGEYLQWTRRNVKANMCVCVCVCERERERERDHNQEFTVLKEWIRFFRYFTNITAWEKLALGSR
jgi:hypothetical protein